MIIISILCFCHMQVTDLESAVCGGTKVEEKEFLVLTELLMVQLLKLDGIEAGGEAKLQRRMEVNWLFILQFVYAFIHIHISLFNV